jgi:hypothetical protein
MRIEPNTRAELDLVSDGAKRPDITIVADLRRATYNGGRMNKR